MTQAFPLQLHGVFDKGTPNRERICIHTHTDVNIKYYGLFLGLSVGRNFAIPIPDNFFWFGDLSLNKGDWVFLYTGKGTFQSSTIPNGTAKLHTMFWNRDRTIFHDPNIVPILASFHDVQIDHYSHANPLPTQTGTQLQMT